MGQLRPPQIIGRHNKRHSHRNGKQSRKTPSRDNTINSREVISIQTVVVFSKGDVAGDEETWAPMQWLIIKQVATKQGASACNAHTSSNNNRADINISREDTNSLNKFNTETSVLSLPTSHTVGPLPICFHLKG